MFNRKNQTIDIMLDLETLGNQNCPVLIQLSAVAFNLETKEIYGQYNSLISPQSCVKAKLQSDGSTVDWWLQQEMSVVKKVFVDAVTSGKDLSVTLDEFTLFVNNLKKTYQTEEVLIWGNGMLADNRWILSAYNAVKKEPPWCFWQDQDVRTMVNLGHRLLNFDPKKDIPFEGEKHNAIDDCKHQIKYICAIYEKLVKLLLVINGEKNE